MVDDGVARVHPQLGRVEGGELVEPLVVVPGPRM
jgi:hypothetical protein